MTLWDTCCLIRILTFETIGGSGKFSESSHKRGGKAYYQDWKVWGENWLPKWRVKIDYLITPGNTISLFTKVHFVLFKNSDNWHLDTFFIIKCCYIHKHLKNFWIFKIINSFIFSNFQILGTGHTVGRKKFWKKIFVQS